MYRHKNYIITGGCGSGKTTLIEYINQKHKTVPERIREVGREMQLPDDPKFLLRDVDSFTEEIVRRKVKDYLENEDEICFFDRGIPDCLVVFPMHGKEPSDYLRRLASEFRYNSSVFLLDTLPDFDSVKHPFTLGESIYMQKKLYRLYLELGYNIIIIPVDNVQRRMDYVLKNI